MPTTMASVLAEEEKYSFRKKLDLNAPLLSTRRHGTAPNNIDNIKHSEDEDGDQSEWGSPRSEFFEMPASASGSLRSPGAVPFIWEQSPGRPKAEPASLKTRFMPTPPPCRSMTHENAGRINKTNWDESSDGAYSAMSHISGFEDLRNSPCTDPGARDFIMRRFLPAAKAMADESSPAASPLVQSIAPPPSSRSPYNVRHAYAPGGLITQRLQTSQYKFSSAQVEDECLHEFSMHACGFIPVNFAAALRRLRRAQLPPSGQSKKQRKKHKNVDSSQNRFSSESTTAFSPHRTSNEGNRFLGMPEDYQISRSASERKSNDVDSESKPVTNATQEVDAPPLPTPPTHSWLWKVPFPQKKVSPTAKWEAAIKSSQVRTGHRRYSEENALSSCKHL